jgi:hypothetical protein
MPFLSSCFSSAAATELIRRSLDPRISGDSSCIFSAASYQASVPGDAKNAAISSTDSATKAKAAFVFYSKMTFAVQSKL